MTEEKPRRAFQFEITLPNIKEIKHCRNIKWKVIFYIQERKSESLSRPVCDCSCRGPRSSNCLLYDRISRGCCQENISALRTPETILKIHLDGKEPILKILFENSNTYKIPWSVL